MSLNNHETNEIRGAILTILIVDDPHEVSEKVIEYTLSNMKMCTCPAILKDHTNFLLENGYVECRKIGFETKMDFFRLTTKEIDFLTKTSHRF